MDTSDLLRYRITASLSAQRTDKVADAAINLWEKLATEIIAIVGEDGFNSLYVRSVFLTQSTFPWLASNSLSAQTGQRFAELKMRLAEQTSVQASEANSLLLTTFTGILASLVGEALTDSILRSAWGNDVSDRPSKELKNE